MEEGGLGQKESGKRMGEIMTMTEEKIREMVGFLFYVLLLERKIVMMINVTHLKKECNLTKTDTFLSLKYPYFFFLQLN